MSDEKPKRTIRGADHAVAMLDDVMAWPPSPRLTAEQAGIERQVRATLAALYPAGQVKALLWGGGSNRKARRAARKAKR